jgi:multiple sugar transport system permease protein
MKWARIALLYALLAAVALWTVVPLVWMFATSLQPPGAQVPTLQAALWPDAWPAGHRALSNYSYVLTIPELPIWRFALNSAIVTTGVVALQLALCSLAAFAFARLRFAGRDGLFLVFLLTMMVPTPVLIVPLFSIVRTLGWLDSYLGLIVPYPYISTAFGTFLLRQYMLTIPRSLDEAARLDGCSDFLLLWRVILPACKPALATLAAFAFIWTWGDFYWPLLATTRMEMRTLEVGLAIFRDSYAGTHWPLQMTVAMIVLTPVLIVFLAMQRFFVRGALTSGLKA